MSEPIYTSPTEISDVRRSLATAERNRTTNDTSISTIQSAATTLAARVTALETANQTVLQSVTDNNGTLAVTDEVIIFKALGAIKTCTLPAVAAASGRFYVVIHRDTSWSVTVTCASGEFYGTDNSNHTKYSVVANHAATFFSDGTKWYVISDHLAADTHGNTFA